MTWRRRVLVAALVVSACAAMAVAWSGKPGWLQPAAPSAHTTMVVAAHVPPLAFTPPPPGTYQLERILDAPDGAVLDSDGSAHSLRAFTSGKVTLFSFVYTYCTDAKGCPLAYATLQALKATIADDVALRGRVRFVSMSFDPAFDTPAMMRSYGGADARATDAVPWHFLTTASKEDLAPVLAGFGQDVSVTSAGAPGQRAPVLRHLLKVFLIDRAGVVREIYSPAYLHPEVLRNDIVTLLTERTSLPATGLPAR